MYLEEGWPWDMVFGVAIWNIWKPRNQRVFGGTEDYNSQHQPSRTSYKDAPRHSACGGIRGQNSQEKQT
jgi:hypothetical protein